jgi:quinoprotein glucose dehydrogenase
VVYRGPRLPELAGHYLYADYVSGKVWALKYDSQAKRVAANRSIESATTPYIAMGEDEKGEVYLTDVFGQFWMIERATKERPAAGPTAK